MYSARPCLRMNMKMELGDKTLPRMLARYLGFNPQFGREKVK